MNDYDLTTPPVSAMFIEHEVRQGMVELHGQLVASRRSEARNFGTRAGAIYRAGRKILGIVNPCVDCGHKDYDPEEFEVDCNTPRCPKQQQQRSIIVAKRG